MHPDVGPLTGLLVADLSRVLAGPYATQIMADLGATVVKVEAPAGDETRGWRPPERDGVSTYYLGINRNKRDVVLDFADPDDRADAAELCRRADVVDRELPSRRSGALRPRLRLRRRDEPGRRVRLDQRLRCGRGRAPARATT